MKRLLCMAALAVAVAVPFGASADDIDDGKECRDGTADVAKTGSESDRGSFCVHAGGVTVLYVGGEAQAEEESNQGTGGACGAIIVADQNVTGTEDWDNPGPDGEAGTADDEHCD